MASHILQKFGEFSCIFEERPHIFVFTPIFWKNTPVCFHSTEQHSSSPDELNDTLHDKIALLCKLHAHAIFSQITWISA